MAAICVIFVLTAFFRCSYLELSYLQIQSSVSTDIDTELTGIIYQKEIRSNSYLYYFKTEYKTVLVYADTDEIPIGSAATVHGSLESFSHATNEGVFDLADYYRYRNITFRMFAEEIWATDEPGYSFRECLYQLQKRISDVFSSELNARDAGVLSALVTGNKGLMDQEVKDLYQDAGISHILAISGLHISVLGLGIFRFLRKIRLSYPVSAVVGSLIVISFVVMSGMGVSARRALIMYLLLMGAEVMGRAYDSLNALALAALLLLIQNPMNLYQSGFQFSFMAMGAIVLSSQVMQKFREEREELSFIFRFLHRLPEQLLSGAFLQLFLLPLTAWIYYEVPLYALFLNLLVLPLCSWLLGAGLLGGLTGLYFTQISKWILILCHFILLIYEKSIAAVNCLPYSQVITGKPSAWLLLIYYVFLVGLCLWYLNKRMNFGSRTGQPDSDSRNLYSGRVAAGVTYFVPLFLLVCILFVPKRGACRIDFLDVGQGDGIYLSDGEGMHVMIDGGSSSEDEVGAYRIEPFLKYHGVKNVDVWILTHGDEDHYSGLLELLEDGYEVKYLLLAKSMPRDETWEILVEAAEANGTEVILTEEGDSVRMADSEMTCLYPSAEDAGDDTNALSQVWLFERNGMSVLFTGDIGEEEEKLLVERNLLRDCVVLKAAHHGSKYSSSAEMLEVLSPEYTVISCGEGNSYGHPHAETLQRLEYTGSEILLTQDAGQITFYQKRGNWRMRVYNKADD